MKLEKWVSVRSGARVTVAFRLLLLLLGGLALWAASPVTAVANPVVLENQQPGTDRWQLGLPGYTKADDTSKSITFYITVNPVQRF